MAPGQGQSNAVRAVSKHINISSLLMSVLLLAVALCAFSSKANAGTLYKWVDDNGQIRYSDRLPPKQVRKKHQQLNSQGMVLSTKEAAKSDEELAAAAEAKRKLEEHQAAEAKVREAQFRLDRVLLLTFSTDAELTLARDNRLEVLESVIELINKSIHATQQQLDRLQTSADEIYLSKGKEVPGGLAQKIEHFTRKIENRSGQLEAKMAEKSKINKQYRVDLARFRELKVVQH